MKKLYKRLLKTAMILTAICLLAPFARTDAAENTLRASINGKTVESCDGRMINGVIFIPIRSFSEQFNVNAISWYQRTGKAVVEFPGLTVEAKENEPYISANGRVLYSGALNFIEDGKMYVPARTLCKAMGLSLAWDGEAQTVKVNGKPSPISPANEFYDPVDLYWLSRIISCEAGNTEPLQGQIAVGNVVLNRVKDISSPNTVFEVIFDRRYGIQFSPAYTPFIFDEPCESAIIAAKICLEGYSISDSALFFYAPEYAEATWIEASREYLFTIGGHRFFA